MSALQIALLGVPLAPLVGFLVLVLAGRRADGPRAGKVACAAVAVAFVASLGVAAGSGLAATPVRVPLGEWIRAGSAEVELTVSTAALPALVPATRDQIGTLWWPYDPRLEPLLARMWDPDGAVGVRPMLAPIAPGEILTDLNLPAAPILVPAQPGRRQPMAVEAGLAADPLSLLMILLVTGVGLLIHVFSIGYMAGDAGVRRYFAYLNLFTFSMLLLVLADSFLLLFVGWELVGLCSYLLISFWHEDPANASAGRKAFLVNRVGDFAFIVALLAVWAAFGSLSYEAVLPRAEELLPLGGAVATLIALGLLVGATGKSAQIPLFVWLPDAMAGPTPVSALIHAATMVTAGVYMIARTHAVFERAPAVLDLVGVVGVLTALVGALAATVQVDIKRVLAYSTVSQLGYMFAGLGAGAFAAAVFHLVTHAFFKALLFLGAGSVMHAVEHAPAEGGHGGRHPLAGPKDPFGLVPAHQDLRLMGGLARRTPVTAATFAVGALALGGVFPLAGFWSKDEILLAAFTRGTPLWLILYLVALATAGLTAFYAGRVALMAFAGQPRSAAAGSARESPPVMVGPLVALAALASLGGLLALPAAEGNWLSAFLAPSLGAHRAENVPAAPLAALALAMAGIGLGLAWRRYGLAEATGRRGAPRTRALVAFAASAFYVDRAYALVVARPYAASASWLMRRVEVGVIDGAVNALGRGTVLAAQAARRTQTGQLRAYALAILAAAAALAAYLARGTR